MRQTARMFRICIGAVRVYKLRPVPSLKSIILGNVSAKQPAIMKKIVVAVLKRSLIIVFFGKRDVVVGMERMVLIQ
tara:strand:+ start:685 stop:912 length:228 start_codon:yes stop_codon:yes gene_type:complete